MGNSCSQNKKKKNVFKLRFNNCWPSLSVPVYRVSLVKGLNASCILNRHKQNYLFISRTKEESFHCSHGWSWTMPGCEGERTVSAGCQQGREDQFSMLFSSENISKNKPSFQPEQLIGCPLPPPMWSVPSLRASKEGKVSMFSDLENRQNREKKFTYI